MDLNVAFDYQDGREGDTYVFGNFAMMSIQIIKCEGKLQWLCWLSATFHRYIAGKLLSIQKTQNSKSFNCIDLNNLLHSKNKTVFFCEFFVSILPLKVARKKKVQWSLSYLEQYSIGWNGVVARWWCLYFGIFVPITS